MFGWFASVYPPVDGWSDAQMARRRERQDAMADAMALWRDTMAFGLEDVIRDIPQRLAAIEARLAALEADD
jgi:hypothetical protein